MRMWFVGILVGLLLGAGCASHPDSKGQASTQGRGARGQGRDEMQGAEALVETQVIHAGAAEADENATTEEVEPAVIVESILGKPTRAEDLLQTYVYPRTDIEVLMNSYPVPQKAGLQTEIHFFKCPCGRLLLTGHYFLIDWETNDVIDELRKAQIQIVSVAPAFLDSKPAMTILRFQAEGEASELANAIKASMQWIGEERNAHPKLEDLVPKE